MVEPLPLRFLLACQIEGFVGDQTCHIECLSTVCQIKLGPEAQVVFRPPSYLPKNGPDHTWAGACSSLLPFRGGAEARSNKTLKARDMRRSRQELDVLTLPGIQLPDPDRAREVVARGFILHSCSTPWPSPPPMPCVGSSLFDVCCVRCARQLDAEGPSWKVADGGSSPWKLFLPPHFVTDFKRCLGERLVLRGFTFRAP